MFRWLDGLILLALWAVTYLAFLGSSELRSEEGHRVLPAVQMLDSGNYLVPYIGAAPYLSKPPLVNWVVAGSFRLFGVRNDWTARLPSPLFLLSVALFLLTFARRLFGRRGSIAAAFTWLTILGLVEKGRMIEIEAIYVSIFAIALILWLVWWQEKRSSWLTFTVPWIFLGLGLLTKGPTHVLFFYVLVCAILWRTRRLRELLHPSHLFGILLMLTIFFAWAVPYFRALHWHSPMEAWSRETTAAFHGEEGRMENWSLNFPRGFAYFLPWLILVPFVRLNKITEALAREVVRGLICGSALLFVVVLLIPGTLPRYVLPLAAPFCWIIGVAVSYDAFDWNVRLGKLRLAVPALLVASLLAVSVLAGTVIFPLRSATFLRRHEYLKGIAAQINALVPPNETLYAVNPPYQPYFFYLRPSINYLHNLDEVPRNARYLLAPPSYQHQIEASRRWSTSTPRLIARTPRANSSQTILFALAQ